MMDGINNTWVEKLKQAWQHIGFPDQFDLEGQIPDKTAMVAMSNYNIYGLVVNRWVPGLCSHVSSSPIESNVSMWLTTARKAPYQYSLTTAISHLIGNMGPSHAQRSPKIDVSDQVLITKLGTLLQVNIVVLDRLQNSIKAEFKVKNQTKSTPTLCVMYDGKRQYRPVIFTELKKTVNEDEYYAVSNMIPPRIVSGDLIQSLASIELRPCKLTDATKEIQLLDLPISNVGQMLLENSLNLTLNPLAVASQLLTNATNTTNTNTTNTTNNSTKNNNMGWGGKLLTGVALAASIATLLKLVRSSKSLKNKIRQNRHAKDSRSIKQKYRDERKLKHLQNQIHHRSNKALKSQKIINVSIRNLKREKDDLLIHQPSASAKDQLDHIKQIDMQLRTLEVDKMNMKKLIAQIPMLKQTKRDRYYDDDATDTEISMDSLSSSSSSPSSSSSSSSSSSDGSESESNDSEDEAAHHSHQLKEYRINPVTDRPILKKGPTAHKLKEAQQSCVSQVLQRKRK